MIGKNILVFGGSGQIGRHLIRRLTKNNHLVTVVTRNLHQKGAVLKTQGNPGYIEIVETNVFDEEKLYENVKTCIDAIIKAKPSSLKGTYLKKFVISSTMGPGIKIDKSHFIN